MTTEPESTTSSELEARKPRRGNWLKIAMISAGSAVAGGVAAAWWYRKTLDKLRETGEIPKDPHFGISRDVQSGGADDET
jgi:hypothetical protein